MRREIRVPEEIQATAKWSKLTVLDGIIIICSFGIGFLSKGIVFPLLQIPYVAFFPIALYILLLPSADVPSRKNYQVAITVLRKDRNVYKSIDINSSINKIEGEENAI
ncbi:Uncharacterised protein [[Clostridium] sordellii]|uniref:DUF5592 family protein n=1 Tax=Paraclostridium sordellii TaxID=1505 RepID=UPI0005E22B4B|nr:DUF5592 family protein [Paeniclostridium sordellii]CEN25508.1 Uncharacterised protein [[Clostridium] sordellii] [Paeniclostridium sordellii]